MPLFVRLRNDRNIRDRGKHKNEWNRCETLFYAHGYRKVTVTRFFTFREELELFYFV